jgi:hypothetical protein
MTLNRYVSDLTFVKYPPCPPCETRSFLGDDAASQCPIGREIVSGEPRRSAKYGDERRCA